MSKLSVKYLLIAMLALSAAEVAAHTNKTFLMPRPQGVNLPMGQTTFREIIDRKSCNTSGSNFQVTGFYQHSENSADLAKYFLIHEKSSINFLAGATQDGGGNPINTVSTVTNDLDIGYLDHTSGVADPTPINDNKLSLGLNPKQSAYGFRFDYYQNLGMILDGLYLAANIPLVHVENDPKLNVKAVDTTSATAFANFLTGKTGNTDPNLTAKLTHAKIGPKQASSGFADLDLQLGYKLFDSECFSLSIGLGGTIPTGNKATGVFLFEPIRGNGQHYAVGGDLSTSIRLFGNYCHNLKFNLTAQYRYLFEDRERRTMGIKGKEFGQYFLLGQAGSATLVPAANVLTLPVNVTPGNQFDGIAGFTYNNGRFTLDCGYNLYYRDEERVRLRDTFVDNTFAVAGRGFVTTAPFVINATNVDGGNVAVATINNSTIDTSVAQTPSQLTHSVYGGIGGVFNKSGDVAFMVSAGGKYEWVDQNSALEQWSVYGKVGFGF